MLRDLETDIAICRAVNTSDLESVARFINAAKIGWPATIRELQEAEKKIDRLRDEIDMLRDQLRQRRNQV